MSSLCRRLSFYLFLVVGLFPFQVFSEGTWVGQQNADQAKAILDHYQPAGRLTVGPVVFHQLPSQQAWRPKREAKPLPSDEQLLGSIEELPATVPNMEVLKGSSEWINKYDKVYRQFVPGRTYRVEFQYNAQKNRTVQLSESVNNAFQQQINFLKYYRWSVETKCREKHHYTLGWFARTIDAFVDTLMCVQGKASTQRFTAGIAPNISCEVKDGVLVDQYAMLGQYLNFRRQAYSTAERALMEPGDKALMSAFKNLMLLSNIEPKAELVASPDVELENVAGENNQWKVRIQKAISLLNEAKPGQACIVPIPVPAAVQPKPEEKPVGSPNIIIQINQGGNGQQAAVVQPAK